MDFISLIETIFIGFFAENIYIAIALAAVFILLLIRKPKVFFAVICLAALLVGALYLISTLSSTGVSQKEKLLQKEEQLYKNYSR